MVFHSCVYHWCEYFHYIIRHSIVSCYVASIFTNCQSKKKLAWVASGGNMLIVYEVRFISGGLSFRAIKHTYGRRAAIWQAFKESVKMDSASNWMPRTRISWALNFCFLIDPAMKLCEIWNCLRAYVAGKMCHLFTINGYIRSQNNLIL